MKKNILIGAALFGAVALCGVAVKRAVAATRKDFKDCTDDEQE